MPVDDAVIQMQNITKTFFTDEVETDALAGVGLEVRSGEFISVSGLQALASQPCWAS